MPLFVRHQLRKAWQERKGWGAAPCAPEVRTTQSSCNRCWRGHGVNSEALTAFDWLGPKTWCGLSEGSLGPETMSLGLWDMELPLQKGILPHNTFYKPERQLALVKVDVQPFPKSGASNKNLLSNQFRPHFLARTHFLLIQSTFLCLLLYLSHASQT